MSKRALAVGLALLVGVAFGSPAIAVTDAAKPDGDGAILTKEDKHLIARACGDEGSQTIKLDDGILVCGDGRRIENPEVRAMVARIGPRITEQLKSLESLSVLTDGRLERILEDALSDLPGRP